MTLVSKFILMEGGTPPFQAHRHDAGWDLTAIQDYEIAPREIAFIHSGVKAAIPEGYWGLIVGRSSFSKRRLLVYPGVVDSGFRGELCVYMQNMHYDPEVIKKGERCGQIILVPHPDPMEWLLQAGLPEGERGTQGFGSTGR